MLCISHAIIALSDKSYLDLFSSNYIRAMHIVEIAFQAFFNNTKALVSDGICKDILSSISHASFPAQQKQASKLGK